MTDDNDIIVGIVASTAGALRGYGPLYVKFEYYGGKGW